MAPGDMVLYESHSVIHGRPFPLNGKFYANVFVHFEPVGMRLGGTQEDSMYDPALDLPPYLVPGSVWEKDWRSKNPNGWKGVSTLTFVGVSRSYCSGPLFPDNVLFTMD
jgi:prolyl 4-hydroxylase